MAVSRVTVRPVIWAAWSDFPFLFLFLNDDFDLSVDVSVA
jgi:hypothetical protein